MGDGNSWCTCRRKYPSGYDTSGCPVHDRKPPTQPPPKPSDAARSVRPPSPTYWPGDVPGGESGYTDHEEIGPIGAGTPHARMHWFWDRMHKHNDLIEELTGWSILSSKYTFEAAIADAFDKLVEERDGHVDG